MRWTDVVLILGGLAIGFFGWILLAGGILTLGETEEKVGMVGHVVLTIMLGLVPAVLGMWMIWIPFRNRRRRKKEQLERTILRLAADSDGVLTQAHVARSTELTLDEAKTVLDELLLSGHCVSDMTEDGQIIYRFGGAG